MREANTRYKQGLPKYTFHSQGVHTKSKTVHSEEPRVKLPAGFWVCAVRMADGRPNNTNTLLIAGRGSVEVEVVNKGLVYELQIVKEVKG